MSKFSTFCRIMMHEKNKIPLIIWGKAMNCGLTNIIGDRMFLKITYRLLTGKKLNIDNPKTFNEKIQWLKLYDRKPEYTILADKYEVKKYLAEIIGNQYLIPTYGVWEKFCDIDFSMLPDKFVLKCTHDSGGVVIVRNKEELDFKKIKHKFEKSLKRNFYWNGREWPYKNIKPRIIAEKYLEYEGHAVPEDYKIYCFNGEPRYIAVFHNRFDNSKILSETVYDTQWRFQNISLDNHFAICNEVSEKPECLEELLDICRRICAGYSQLRVDFYIIENRIYFGEITFYTAGGFQPMIPEKMDEILGGFINLDAGIGYLKKE